MIKLKDESFSDWCERNEQELTEIFAESGADREFCFNREDQESMLYENSYYKLYGKPINPIRSKKE